MAPVYCRICQYNPCMCGAAKRDPREYMTEAQAKRENERQWEKTYGNEDWAFPDPPSP